MNLSPHFTLAEAMRSQTASRAEIDNTPPSDVIPALRNTASHILEPIRLHFGIPFSPSSWFRCLELNRLLKSKDTSQHIRGEAVDVELPGVPNRELARWVSSNLEFDQLILEFHKKSDPASGWVHISWVPDNRRTEVLTMGKGYVDIGLPE